MIKNKKLAIILAVFVLGVALVGGSVLGQEGAVEAVDGAVASTVNGVLKAVDAVSGTVTVAAATGEEIVLTLSEESKIQIADVPADFTQLTAKVNSNVTVEYQPDTKTVIVINAQ